MASPSLPNPSPTAIPPSSSTSVPPLPSNSTIIPTSPPTVSQPNQTADTPPPSSPSTPSNSSAPPQSAPPPSPPQSPPPLATPPPTSPPPAPPPSPPPSPPTAPPPSPPAAAAPTASSSPPPPILSPPPPSVVGSPPQPSPSPPAATPPPAPVQSSPPLPSNSALPPTVNSPPPSLAIPPESSPPPPPPSSLPSPPPSSGAPPGSTSSPPPPLPLISSPPPLGPPRNSSGSGGPFIPSLPTEKPTARTTTPDPNITADTTPRNPRGLNGGTATAIGIIVGFLSLSLIAMAVWFVHKRKKRKSGSNGMYMMPSPFASSQNSDSVFIRTQQQHSVPLGGSASGSNFMYTPDHGGVGNSRSWFTYEELAEATDDFSAKNILGEGGFGCVYKGFLADGRDVAVKQLKIGGGQGEREFRAEVEIISRVHHRHLVSLVGYCISEHQRLLVYDYVPNNTLHYHLHDQSRPVMDWETRVRVAAGAARGLAYLHEDCHPRIIHRDIKSSNILIDNNFEARVADFGLAKLALDANTHVTTRVMGTFGYMAPEYASSGKLTEKSDVYSFGVVLLELITGRKPVDASQPLGDESLVEWARPLLAHAIDNENFEELVDPRLEKNYVSSEMFRMSEAAAACVRHLASRRPRMSQVVRALDSIGEFSDLTNGMKPGQSEIYNSREQSAQIRMFQRMAFGSQDYSSDFFNYSQSSMRSRD